MSFAVLVKTSSVFVSEVERRRQSRVHAIVRVTPLSSAKCLFLCVKMLTGILRTHALDPRLASCTALFLPRYSAFCRTPPPPALPLRPAVEEHAESVWLRGYAEGRQSQLPPQHCLQHLWPRRCGDRYAKGSALQRRWRLHPWQQPLKVFQFWATEDRDETCRHPCEIHRRILRRNGDGAERNGIAAEGCGGARF